jgi:hypothetical protein
MFLGFSFLQDKPRSSIIIFDITLGPEPLSMRQQWEILSMIFKEIQNGGLFIGYLKLCTPTLFTEEYSSSTSLKILATTEAFPSLEHFVGQITQRSFFLFQQ